VKWAAVVVTLLALVAAGLALRAHRLATKAVVVTQTQTETLTVQAPPAAPPGAAWPTYGFDQARTHAAPFALRPPFRVLWRYEADQSLIEYPPVVADGRLFVGTNHGLVVALDAGTGRAAWRRQLPGCIAASPAVAGALVIVATMGPPPHCGNDAHAGVFAFRRDHGATVWTHRGMTVESPPLVVGDSLVVGAWDGTVSALALTDGHTIWRFHTAAAVKAGAALANGTLYIGSYDGAMYALDAARGTLRWANRVDARFYATAAVADGRVVAATTDGVVHAFATAGGRELWSRKIGRFSYSAAALADGRVFVGSYDHHLYALDARTGDVLWRAEAPGPVSGAPTVLGGLVYFSSCGSCSSYESNPAARRSFGVDAATGRIVWRFPDGEYSPVVTDGARVYLTGYTALYGLLSR
jgi:outer membrane protein assembly factor BamB